MKKRLSHRLKENKLLCAMGVYNPLTARLVEASGFECLYMTGYGVAMGNFAYPDIGLVTMEEMVEVAHRITDRCSLPLIADADTGYGNAVNMIRTVKEYEYAGVQGIQIEDQVFPKRCGHMAGKSLIQKEEMRSKIISAVDSRRLEDTLIIARTDALAIDGYDAAIERGNLYAEWGADIIFIEAARTQEEVNQIPRDIAAPTLLNIAPKTPNYSIAEIAQMGYDIAIYPGITLTASYAACLQELQRFQETGMQMNLDYWKQHFNDMNDMVGLASFRELEEKFKLG